MRSVAIGEPEIEDVRRRLDQAQQPLYISLSNLLRAEINNGGWSAGTRLPSIAKLADRYDVARVTIRQALSVLSSEGLIEAIQGKGTFVSERGARRTMIELDSNWNSFLAALDGNIPELLEVNKSCDLPEPVRRLGKSTGNYRYMKRIHRSQNEAYCVNEVYLDNRYYRRSPKSFDSQMIIPNLSRLARTRLKRMKQSFRIITADSFVARCLDVPLNSSIGEVRRLITTRDDEIVYYGFGQYRGDLVVFNTTIDVPEG
jgi:GntR family transcriptional regulator